MTSEETQAEIHRLFHAEKWKVGTIANQLSLHHEVVERVLQQGESVKSPRVRARMIDSYLEFVNSVLEHYPSLSASRIYEMVKERGYPGRPDHFRNIIATLRPKKPGEAYLRVRTLPGEQAQVDWGYFGKITIGCAERPLWAFVMVLSYSRMTFLHFYLDAKMPNFIRGHVEAFTHFGGVARVILYDNLKSAVLERRGEIIRFNPKLLELKATYHFDPKPVAVARGNEKGRVERKIRHIRDSFFAARKFSDLDDLNKQALDWCTGLAADRPCPEDTSRIVKDVFAEEQPRLLPLPETPFDTQERTEAMVRKQPYVRFDLNDYSIPHDHIRRTVEVRADLETVCIFDAGEKIATHPRSFDKGKQIEDAAHIEELREYKRKAKAHSVLDLLYRSAPSVADFFADAAIKNKSLKKMTGQFEKLLERYGPQKLEEAVCIAIENGTLHVGAVHQILETHRKAMAKPPPIHSGITNESKVRNITVKSHDLKTYDNLDEKEDDNEPK